LRASWYLRFKARRGEATAADSPVFVSARSGRPLGRRRMQDVFRRWCAEAGLSRPYRFHALRHTYATELYRAGEGDLRLVQKQLGHSRITTTQVYADVLDEDAEAAVERLYRRR